MTDKTEEKSEETIELTLNIKATKFGLPFFYEERGEGTIGDWKVRVGACSTGMSLYYFFSKGEQRKNFSIGLFLDKGFTEQVVNQIHEHLEGGEHEREASEEVQAGS